MAKEGIKHDKGKLRLSEMLIDFAPALEELCKVWEFGANKYGKSNWQQVENAKDRYTNALLRHLFAEKNDLYDSESEILHAAHIAFNALARLWFISQEPKECRCNRYMSMAERKKMHESLSGLYGYGVRQDDDRE